MSCQFKVLTTGDHDWIEQAIAIEQAAFAEGGMNHWFLVPFIRHGQVFVLVKDNRVVAVAEYMRDFNDLKLAYLFGFAVAEAYRGQGLGTHLLTKSHEHLKTQGFSKISLTVKPNNQVGLRLYEQFGFVKEAFYPNEYGEGEDRLLLTLHL